MGPAGDRERECPVKLSCTHHMLYTYVYEAGQDGSIPTEQFDPKKGVALYRE